MKVKFSRFLIALLLVVGLGTVISLTTKDMLDDVSLGLDLQGGFEVLYQVKPLNDSDNIDETAMRATANTLDSRVNVLGVSEPNIQIEEGNRVRVQLAGVTDQTEARELLSTQAELTIRDVNDELLLSGADLVEGGASQNFDDMNQPMVSLQLKDSGLFRDITADISERPPGENLMVIWMDFEEGVDSFYEEVQKANPGYISAPSVNQPINSKEVMISGGFQGEEGLKRAQNIAALLNAGSLPVDLEEIYSTSVGAQFGEQALNDTVTAGLLGVALVFVYMLIFYRLPGVVAVITLTVYIYVTIQGFNLISGVLTLPGIAALILGVGMAVDANIILYERIKDELRIGRKLKQAYKKAASQSIWTIFDANLTTLIGGIVLFIFGTSSVKGFATMLILSILMSFLTAVFLTRVFMNLLVNSGMLDNKLWLFGVKEKSRFRLSEGKDIEDLTTPYDRFDFVKSSKLFFGISIVTITAGIVVLSMFQLNLGIDFTSGTRADIQITEDVSVDDVEAELVALDLEPSSITTSGDDLIVARYGEDIGQKNSTMLHDHFSELYGSSPMISTVSPTVGKELAKNAVYALIFAALGIVLYVAIRFEWRMAVPTIIALLHDVFFMVAIFSLFRLEVEITFIAAVLTIVGYSVNDTIVTFDRVRENLRKIKVVKNPEVIDTIVNRSLRQTMTRSINTVLTVILVVVVLVFLGASSITNFSIALLIGLFSGVYSSVFIAIQLWGILKKRQLKNAGGELVVYEEKDPNEEKILV